MAAVTPIPKALTSNGGVVTNHIEHKRTLDHVFHEVINIKYVFEITNQINVQSKRFLKFALTKQ